MVRGTLTPALSQRERGSERVALGEETLALQDLAIQDASSRAVKPVPADALGAPATIVVEAGRQTLDLELRRLGISEDY